MKQARVRYIYGLQHGFRTYGHITARTHWVEEGVQGVLYPLCSNKPARQAWGWANPIPCKTCDRLYAELLRAAAK